MARFVLRRVATGGVVILLVVTLVFFLTRVIANPAAVYLGPLATPEQIELLREELGLNRAIWVQFIDYFRGLAVLDLGESLWQGLPARQIIFERLPATFLLLAGAVSVTVVVFVPLGIIASLKPGSFLDRTIVVGTLAGLSAPGFWVGLIGILIFAVALGWVPSSGSGSLQHLILPSVVLALPRGARIAQITRTAMLDQFSSPYVGALRLRGISERAIVWQHVLRNASLPILTMVFWEIAQLAAGSVVIETVFAWPGVGLLLIQAFRQQDLILLQSGVLVLAALIIFANFLADLSYRLVDPRVELN